MTGQRSRAEMKAKDVLSEVTYGATGTSTLDTMSAVCRRNGAVDKSEVTTVPNGLDRGLSGS